MKLFSKKAFIFTLFLCIYCISFSISYAQDANQLLKEGIAFHDAKKYDKALKKYEQALKLVPNSPVVLYEMALTYFQKQDYKTAIKYSDKVIKSKSQSTISGYILKGSALDMMGKTKKSINLLEGVVKEYPDNYLLHYNLALNYYKVGELKKAEQGLMNAIAINPEHATSHLILGFVEYDMGRKIPSMMALNYFLFLEPTSQRSEKAYEILKKQLSPNVTKGKNNEFTINLSGASKDEFSVIEMALAITGAAKSMNLDKEVEENLNEELDKEGKDENSGDSTKTKKVVLSDIIPKTEEGIFEFDTKMFFSLLKNENRNNTIWWTFYAPTFNTLAESEHITTFCYWISQSSNKNAKKWVEENAEKVLELKKWIAKN